jgi:hypothetical protein
VLTEAIFAKVNAHLTDSHETSAAKRWRVFRAGVSDAGFAVLRGATAFHVAARPAPFMG